MLAADCSVIRSMINEAITGRAVAEIFGISSPAILGAIASGTGIVCCLLLLHRLPNLLWRNMRN